MPQPEKILEIKHKLDGSVHKFHCQTLEKSSNHVVMLYRLENPVTIEDQVFDAGTLSLGYFWEERNYNVYHWVRPNGESQAAYINIADSTTITEDVVEWRDLIIDLLITPDGRCQILDEDELPENLADDLDQLISSETKALQQRHQELLKEIEVRTSALLSALKN